MTRQTKTPRQRAEEALEVADRIFVMRDHTLVGSGDAGRQASILAALDRVEAAVTSEIHP